MKFWRQAFAITRRDLLAEGRAGDVLWIVIPYGALAVFLSPIALNTSRAILSEIGLGLNWLIVLLFGMFVTFRRSAQATPAESDMLALMLGDPASSFLGRTVSSTALLLAFQIVMTPLTMGLFSPLPPRSWIAYAGVAVLAALGLGMIGTIAGSLVAGTGAGTALAPLLTGALSFPLLVGAAIATDRLTGGDSILAPIALLALVDVAVLTAGVLTSRPLEETA
jgi:heme exporter protein B